MMRTSRKPPLSTRSPIRLRSSRILQPNSDPIQTPGTQMKTKSTCKTTWDTEVSPEFHHHKYNTISCEFRALAKMVNDQLRGNNNSSSNINSNGNGNGGFGDANNNISMFERGRFYDEYSARRNERLRRKKLVDEDKKTPPNKLGVRVAESAKTKRTKTITRSSSSSSSSCIATRLRSTTKTKPSLPLASANVHKSRTRIIPATTIHKF